MGITDDHLIQLADADLPKLVSLSLSGEFISDEGLAHLQQMRPLMELYVSGPNMSKEAERQLRAATGTTIPVPSMPATGRQP